MFTLCLNCIMCVGMYLQAVCLHVSAFLFLQLICLPAICPQLSFEWCVIGCVQMTGAGAQGQTSVFPADISDGAVPVLSPATSLMGEPCSQTLNLLLLSFEAFYANVLQKTKDTKCPVICLN